MNTVSARCIVLLFILVASINYPAASPTKNVLPTHWKVHIDLLDNAAGKDLEYFQALIQQQLHQANQLLQGLQGPTDTGCCLDLPATSVSLFGLPGDGLDIIQNDSELQALWTNPGAYLVDSVFYCNNLFSTSIRGCAQSPGNALVVSFDAYRSGDFAATAAHELGHNAGLQHVTDNTCALMAAVASGGCLSIAECAAFNQIANSTNAKCQCLPDSPSSEPIESGTICTSAESSCAFCGGGLCTSCSSGGLSRFTASQFSNEPNSSLSRTLLAQDYASGNWSVSNTAPAATTGLAYDDINNRLYGIQSQTGDDLLIRLDPISRAVQSEIGPLVGIDNATALAYKNGLDRILLVAVDDDFYGVDCMNGVNTQPPCYSALYEVDPTTAAATFLGELNSTITTGGITGLAWNGNSQKLYAVSSLGLIEIKLESCNGITCSTVAIDSINYEYVALSWDRPTNTLARIGSSELGPTQLLVTNGDGTEIISKKGIEYFLPAAFAAAHLNFGHSIPALGHLALLILAIILFSLVAIRKAKLIKINSNAHE